VRGVLFLRLHQNLDPLVVRVDLERREQMIAADPESYFITDHYLNYPWILVRSARVRSDPLPDLIQMAWREARASKRRRV
jgi:hypothetical protein